MDTEPLERPAAEEYAAWFGALADGTRVQIVSLLARNGGSMTVGQIVSAVPVGQSTVSAHLRRLAEVGFVLVEHRSTSSWYRINQACVERFPTAADLIMGRPVPAAARAGAAAGLRGGGHVAQRPAAPDGIMIRPMRPADAEQVLAIYQAGLDTGQASFETTAPSWQAFDRARLPQHRHVAVDASTGEVAGWVAAANVSDRCVYRGVVEHSVYVHPRARGRGTAAALLGALIGSTEAAGIWTIQSGIFPENAASLRLHQRAGFRIVGTRERIGCRDGRWRDVTFLERRSPVAGAADDEEPAEAPATRGR
jgi:L-amino acid N-acyltransferase YncA/DNA-binding transcriptional ArsR family regulator